MRYVTTYSFGVRDLYDTYDISKHVHLSQKIVKKKYGVDRLQYLCASVFVYSFYIILLDIIENNATFMFPLKRGKRAILYVETFTGEKLQEIKRNGGMVDLDLIKSNFCGYRLKFSFEGAGHMNSKSVYISNNLKKKLYDRVYSGVKTSSPTTQLKDYLDQIYAEFPDLPQKTIVGILEHGYRDFYTLNNRGADIIIRNTRLYPFTAYFGKLFLNEDLRARYFMLKYKIKVRLKYQLERRTKPWDGYYYFGLTQEEYDKLIPKKSGRIKQKIDFGKRVICKAKRESCFLQKIKYVYRIPWPQEETMIIFLDKLETRNIELVGTREKDGMVHFKD